MILQERLADCGRAAPTGARRRTSPGQSAARDSPSAPQDKGRQAQRRRGPRREPPPRPGRRFWKVPPVAGPAGRQRRARGEPGTAPGGAGHRARPGRGQGPASAGLRLRRCWPPARPSRRGKPRYLCCQPRSPRKSPSRRGLVRFWWSQQKGRGCGEAHSAEAGGAGPSYPQSPHAEAAAPEMAVAEAANCRMAAAGTSFPPASSPGGANQWTRIDPLRGGRTSTGTSSVSFSQARPPAALTLTVHVRLCQLRYPSAQICCDKHRATARAQPPSAVRVLRTWRPRYIWVRATGGLLEMQGWGERGPPGPDTAPALAGQPYWGAERRQ